MEGKKLSTHEKALQVNLDRERYGAFAEIGAGQEVTRWFFRVGGAAGTIAKSMSAYDMTVSDAIYGKVNRYVSRQRLEKMLEHEFTLAQERLAEDRGFNTAFFTFADTVKAASYRGGGESHGWMGIRFQVHPRMEPSQITLHVRMLDKENLSQQEALGILGVNLVYGAFYHCHKPEQLMESLLDNLSTDRIEVDMIEFCGPDFAWVDSRLMSLKLVQLGLSNAAMFSAAGEVLQPSEVLYKKPIIVERGSFRPVCHVNIDMIDAAKVQFMKDERVQGEEPVELMEITMSNLMATAEGGEIDYKDFLMRAEVLAACGKTVLVSNYFEYYRLGAFLGRFTKKPIAIVLGVPSLREIFNPKYYENLGGGILEAFGRLFKNELKIFVYPMLNKDKKGELVTLDDWKAADEVQNLYLHLKGHGNLIPIEHYNKDYLHIFSREILRLIKEGDDKWEDMVPVEVAYLIKKCRYFGYDEEEM